MKRIVIGLLVAIVLLVAVDFAAASAAEYRVSTTLRSQLALPVHPAVKIDGFPFLVQAVLGDYKQVEVRATDLTVGQLRDVEADATLYHVKVPLSDVLRGEVHGATVESVQGSVQITKQDIATQMSRLTRVTKLSIGPVDDGVLDAAFASSGQAVPGSSVTGIDPDTAVRMVGYTSVLGQQMQVSVIAVLQMQGRQIQVVPRDIRVGSGAQAAKLPSVVQAGLRSLFTMKIDPGKLPFDVTPTRLRAVGDGLEITGNAHNVVLGTPSTQPTGGS
jgi:hypothetical protein